MSNRVLVISPQPEWRSAFAREAARVKAALDGFEHHIEHIGSTAIDGVYAKPIVDMLMLVRSLEQLDSNSTKLERLGYEAKGEYGIPERRYFRLNTAAGARTHHLHAFVFGSDGATRHLAFRDYMKAHRPVALAYSDLKRTLAARHPHDSSSYIAGKAAFVAEHERLALAWVAAQHGA